MWQLQNKHIYSHVWKGSFIQDRDSKPLYENLASLDASYTLKEVITNQVWQQIKYWKWEFPEKILHLDDDLGTANFLPSFLSFKALDHDTNYPIF